MIFVWFGFFFPDFFFSPKQKANNCDLLDMEGYVLPENLHFTRVAESIELLVKMPVMVLPQPSQVNLPLCLGRHKPPSPWQMLPPWRCYPGSPLNPPAGAFLHGLKFLSNNVLIWWFWCLSGTQSTWQKELLAEIAWIICIRWKPNLRSFCSLFPLDYVVKWGLRQPARRREWRVIVAVDLLGDFSHKWVKSCVTKLLFDYFFSPHFSPDLGKFDSSLYTDSEEYLWMWEKLQVLWQTLPSVKK